jgi:hypothetical protein
MGTLTTLADHDSRFMNHPGPEVNEGQEMYYSGLNKSSKESKNMSLQDAKRHR